MGIEACPKIIPHQRLRAFTSLERLSSMWVSPHKPMAMGAALQAPGSKLDGSPIPLGSTATHNPHRVSNPAGRGGSPWTRT